MVCSIFFLRDRGHFFCVVNALAVFIYVDRILFGPSVFHMNSMISPSYILFHHLPNTLIQCSQPLEFCCPVDSISPSAHGHVFRQMFRNHFSSSLSLLKSLICFFSLTQWPVHTANSSGQLSVLILLDLSVAFDTFDGLLTHGFQATAFSVSFSYLISQCSSSFLLFFLFSSMSS